MTIVTATASSTVGVLSADTLTYSYHQFGEIEHGDISDGTPEAFMRALWCGDGTPPRVSPLGYAPKLYAVPWLKMAVAVSGMPLAGEWLREVAAMGARDILDVDALVQDTLARELPGAQVYAPTIIWHVGWSDRAGRVLGFVYRSETGWKSEPFTGHMFGIIPHPDFPGHDTLAESFQAAADGLNTEDWHVGLAQNVEAAYLSGKALRWIHFGGDLLLARVDRNGVSIRTAYRFRDAMDSSWAAPALRPENGIVCGFAM